MDIHSNLEDLFHQIIIDLQGQCLGDVAERAGCHYSTLLNWRNGKVQRPVAEVLMNVAEVLGYTVTWYRTSPPR